MNLVGIKTSLWSPVSRFSLSNRLNPETVVERFRLIAGSGLMGLMLVHELKFRGIPALLVKSRIPGRHHVGESRNVLDQTSIRLIQSS